MSATGTRKLKDKLQNWLLDGLRLQKTYKIRKEVKGDTIIGTNLLVSTALEKSYCSHHNVDWQDNSSCS